MVNYYKDNLDDVFSVLSDPTRRKIVEELSKGEKTVKKLAEPFDMSLPAVSKHLKILEKADLVTFKKEGRYKIYRLNPEVFEAAVQWMNHWRSYWEGQLSRLEDYFDGLEDK
ncbi:metalloregulator ArsR/SmtB family transcription factor [Alkalihalobacillus macyae]|uniref:ArsR/SmtB family transcription factor n=1 Tax=Guptibacillus hwajinpoensis TaxID=208199 RepID=UPI00273A908F|nr:metalloregulator ArsR/SmtB family transcription factor [Alkalihalobacillus macyae]MDP4549567.1 metalloregulator ArsR/SmtB family transcription factor [Alkalihalobacillus macyae]